MEGEPDVLAQGTERESRRPSRRVVSGVLLAGVLLGATGYGLQVRQQNGREREAHRRAVTNIRLGLQQDLDPGNGDLALLNESGIAVRIRRVALDFPDVSVLPRAQRLAPYERLSLSSPAAAACVSELYQRGPRSLLVHGTTADGLDVTRRIWLSEDQQVGVWFSLRQSCRFLTPDEALASRLRSARLQGRTLTLTYELSNYGAVPLVIDGFSYLPGVEVAADALPIALRPREPGTDAPGATAVVRLRVTSCERLAAVLRAALGGDGLDGPAALKVNLHHRYARAQGYVGFNIYRGDQETSVDQGLRLLRTCQQVAGLLETQAAGH